VANGNNDGRNHGKGKGKEKEWSGFPVGIPIARQGWSGTAASYVLSASDSLLSGGEVRALEPRGSGRQPLRFLI